MFYQEIVHLTKIDLKAGLHAHIHVKSHFLCDDRM